MSSMGVGCFVRFVFVFVSLLFSTLHACVFVQPFTPHLSCGSTEVLWGIDATRSQSGCDLDHIPFWSFTCVSSCCVLSLVSCMSCGPVTADGPPVSSLPKEQPDIVMAETRFISDVIAGSLMVLG